MLQNLIVLMQIYIKAFYFIAFPFSPSNLLCLQVYMLKGRLLLSLQAVKQALKLAGPSDPDVHRLVVRLCNAVHQQQQQQQQHQQPPSKATQVSWGTITLLS